MFKEWGFLLGEIWLLLLLAVLLGLLAGWLIWGRSSQTEGNATSGADAAEAERLRQSLADCQRAGKDHAARVAALEAQLKAADARADRLAADAAAPAASATTPPTAAPVAAVAAAVAAAPAAKAEPKDEAKAEAVAEPAPVAEAVKPKGLDAARGGKADDLKLIKGIGPKLEKLCNSLGYFHFDQIAAWTPAEIAWVDDNLEGFKGRVTRDEWVAQARDLAAGKPPRAMADKPDGLK